MTNKIVLGQHDLKTLEQFDDVSSRAVKSALMADGHAGYVMPVGGVAAYDNKVSVIGVGVDIACGNCAIKTNLKLEDITRHKWTLRDIESNPHYCVSDKKLIKIADQIARVISFGIGRSNLADDAPVDDPLFLDHAWYIIPNTGMYRDDLREKAKLQLGTVGGGNHYVDVFVDRNDESIWVGVHFGSRGLGFNIARNFLALGQGMTWGDKGKEIETILDLSTPLGQDYWALMELAGKYAYAGREWVARKVVSFLEGTEIDVVHNHHNFAWKEKHVVEGSERELVVVRKGATPAFPEQRGFVGGSMGDDAVIIKGASVVGNDCTDIGNSQYNALYSTVHGAGRIMSRTEAAGKWRKGIQKSRGRITHEMMNDWMEKKGVIRRGGGLDESPHVYRRLDEVLKYQGDTIKVLTKLRPIITVMAKPETHDPYKD